MDDEVVGPVSVVGGEVVEVGAAVDEGRVVSVVVVPLLALVVEVEVLLAVELVVDVEAASSSGVGTVVGADGPGPVLTVVAGRVVEVVAGAAAETAVVGVVVLRGRWVVGLDPGDSGASVASVPLAVTSVVSEVEMSAAELAVALTAARSTGMATMSPDRTRMA